MASLPAVENSNALFLLSPAGTSAVKRVTAIE